MKKLIIFVLTLFLTFTIILSGKSANAELTPVTPFYGGDIFNGQELYLFQNYSATPNFQNGYISKQTITNQDIYYQENSYYNGWYKNLGEDLIYEYTEHEHEPEHPIFYFYITLNGLLAQYFQFALICPEPFEAEYTIKFRNENPFVFLTATDYNDYLVTPPTNDMTKEIEWFCFEVYFPDYMASFKPLTAQLAYEFGFSSGEREGYNNGYNTGYSNGYNNGHTDGYNEGSIDTQYGVNTVVSFNQIVSQAYNVSNSYATFTAYQDETRIYGVLNATNNTEDIIYLSNIFDISPRLTQYHVYAWQGLTSASDITYRCGFYPLYTSSLYRYNLNSFGGIFTYIYYDANTKLQLQVMPHSTLVDVPIEFQLFDLTEIYGSGHEPTNYETFKNDFPSSYYPYTQESLINIDYENGYIKGQKLGYNLGYDDGKDAQATQQLTSTGWISSIFGGISSLLNIQIFPGVTIGIIVGIPFVISLAYFVIRAFRGGGGA